MWKQKFWPNTDSIPPNSRFLESEGRKHKTSDVRKESKFPELMLTCALGLFCQFSWLSKSQRKEEETFREMEAASLQPEQRLHQIFFAASVSPNPNESQDYTCFGHNWCYFSFFFICSFKMNILRAECKMNVSFYLFTLYLKEDSPKKIKLMHLRSVPECQS